MKNYVFAILALCSVSISNAQINVDSSGHSYMGKIPAETFDKMTDATTTIYGDSINSALNIYSDYDPYAAKTMGAPFLIQGVVGNTNSSSPVSPTTTFQRVFYVDYNGYVYSKNGTLMPAVDPLPYIFPPTSEIKTGRSVDDAGASALSKLSGIKGVLYSNDNDEASENSVLRSSNQSSPARKRLGLLAKDVEASIPEAVVTLGDSAKYISYSDIVVVLVDAVNELSRQVADLKQKLDEAYVATERYDVASIDAASNEYALENQYISQNAPNPFSETSVINYELPNDARKAVMYIYDINGQVMKRLDLAGNKGHVTVLSSDLRPGIYTYTLVADGVELASRKMIVNNK